METRTENELRCGKWPEQLTPANVAGWLWTSHGLPKDAVPILHAMQLEAVKGSAIVTAHAGERVKALTDLVERFCAHLYDSDSPLVDEAYRFLGKKVDVLA